MAMTLEAAEAEQKVRWLAIGKEQERERQLNAHTLATLQETLSIAEIPTVDLVVLGSLVLTEVQRKLLTEFWEIRAQNFYEYKRLEEFEKVVAVLKERRGEEKTAGKTEAGKGEGKGSRRGLRRWGT